MVKLLDTREWYECQDIFLITDAIVSIVDTRLRLPTEILLKGMQLEFYYEYLGQARHQMWVSLATFAMATYTTPRGPCEIQISLATLELGCETLATAKH